MRNVFLDSSELVLLESILTPSEVSVDKPDASGYLPPSIPSKSLMLKIGSALLQCLNGEEPIEVSLTEAECWILRERVNIFSVVGSDKVGRTIKAKLYQRLLEFDYEGTVGPMATTDYQEYSAKEVKNALEKRSNIADPNTDEDHSKGDANSIPRKRKKV